MLVFRYDKTFDGLLSALFDAYSLHVFPEALIGPGGARAALHASASTMS